MGLELIDRKTGEILLKDERFVKMQKGYEEVKATLKGEEYMILNYFLENMKANNRVVFTSEDKKDLAKTWGVVTQTIANRIARLKKKDILVQICPGSYMINPRMYNMATLKDSVGIKTTRNIKDLIENYIKYKQA